MPQQSPPYLRLLDFPPPKPRQYLFLHHPCYSPEHVIVTQGLAGGLSLSQASCPIKKSGHTENPVRSDVLSIVVASKRAEAGGS